MSARTEIWMPWYIGDYLRDTMGLSGAEHGAYLLILAHAWMTGGRVTTDPAKLARIACLTPKEWQAAAPTVLSFFQIDGAWMTQKRITQELERAERFIESRRENGRLGGRPKKPTDNLDVSGRFLNWKPTDNRNHNLDKTHTCEGEGPAKEERYRRLSPIAGAGS